MYSVSRYLWDVLNWCSNAIRVFREMKEAGHEMKGYGIRIDSGDLAYLSKQAYKMLDEAGRRCYHLRIQRFRWNISLKALPHRVPRSIPGCWYEPDHLGDNPAFGGVYKLAAIREQRGPGFLYQRSSSLKT